MSVRKEHAASIFTEGLADIQFVSRPYPETVESRSCFYNVPRKIHVIPYVVPSKPLYTVVTSNQHSDQKLRYFGA